MITGVMPVQGDVYPIVRIYCHTELTVIWPDGRELSDWTGITTSILPAGLILVRATGVLRGRLTREDAGKTHLIKFTVPNAFDEDTKTIELVAGGDHEGNVRFRETILPAAAIHGARMSLNAGEREMTAPSHGDDGLPTGLRVVEVRQTPAP